MRKQIPAYLLFILLPGCMFLFGNIDTGEVPQQVEDRYVTDPEGVRVDVWQTGLEIPWSLVFIDENRALVSERPGRIRMIRNDTLLAEPWATLDVRHTGEGGLMGLAVHPEFDSESYIYAMLTYGGITGATNKVVRIRYEGNSGGEQETIIDNIPGARFHNGGRIAFGPDNMLYITTGENFDPELAQDMDKLAGKILRITPEGGIPQDNPFPDSPVWTLGHRNPQGIDWHHESGEMFASGHGPSGEFRLQGKDMINHIKKGKNYGWPEVIGAIGNPAYEDPLIMWMPATPPGGIAFYQDELFVATLRSKALIRIGLDMQDPDEPDVKFIERWFADGEASGKYGRLRDVTVGPDETIYITTSNRDGRGDPVDEDDRILKITQDK